MSIIVNPSIAVEIIKMLMIEADQKLWNYKGCEGRQQRLDELMTIYNQCLSKSLKLTEEELNNIEITIMNKCIPVFFLSYFGEDVSSHIRIVIFIYKNIFQKHIERIDLKANVNKEESLKKPIKKILFISDRLTGASSVLRDRGNVIKALAEMKDVFEIECMTKAQETEDALGKSILEKVNKVHRFTGDIEKDADIIIEQKYDIIIYCDCHMSEQVSCLSLFRLAPFQFSTWGHSETTGTCDGYFCNELYENKFVNNWQKQYTEPTLFIQKGLGTCYSRPIDDSLKQHYKGREHFCLPKDYRIYLTTSSLFKMGSEMFDIFEGILKKDDNSIIVITKQGSYHDEEFYKSMNQRLSSAHITRIYMIQRCLTVLDIQNLLSIADVYLESYPFGNLNSTMECFCEYLPIVTWSTNKMNGRFTRGFYKKMGLNTMITYNTDEYINTAVKIATDKKLNKFIRAEIKLSMDRLFNDKETIKEWKDILLNYCSNKPTETDVEIYNNV